MMEKKEKKIEKVFGIITFIYLALATLIYSLIAFFTDVSPYHIIIVGIPTILVTIIAIMRGWLK